MNDDKAGNVPANFGDLGNDKPPAWISFEARIKELERELGKKADWLRRIQESWRGDHAQLCTERAELKTQLETTKGDLSALLKSALNERKTRIKQDAKLSQLRAERDKLKEDIQIGINVMQDGDNMKPEKLIMDMVDYFNRVLAGEDMNEPDAQAQKGERDGPK